MSQEQHADLNSWWSEVSFPGKELYRMEPDGSLVMNSNTNIKERVIATLAPENADVVIKALQEKYPAAEARVKELELEWLETEDKLKLADKVASVSTYLQQVNAIGDMDKLATLVRDWEHTIFRLTEENYEIKLKLAEMAESLAGSDNWKETTQAFKDIADKWKQAGHLDRGRNDKLWNRIEAARKEYNDRKRLQHDEDEKDLLVNLDLKIDLVEQAESIANSEEWKSTTEAFHRLTEEWKTIGRTHNKKNEELWQRFLAAKSNFFERKRANFNKIQQEQENNYLIKTALLEKAEALKESTDWGATSQAFAGLMEEWKKTGRIPQEKGDDLWKSFNAAQEHFFDAKRKHTESIRTEQEANYELKKVLLDRALKLQHSTHWGETSAELNELLDQWKKIGPVPRAHSQSMWEEFIAARKHFFARKDANRDQRKQFASDQRVARIEQAKGMAEKLRADLKEEEDKIADFKTALENITPGKKAAELRNHLEQLITEGKRQIRRIQEKLSLANEDTSRSAAETSDAGDSDQESAASH